jgi:hypothetical protein
VAYYVEASTLSEAQWASVAAELHDRMMESVFTAEADAASCLNTISLRRYRAWTCWGRAVRR